MPTLTLLRRPHRAARTLHPRIPNRPALDAATSTFAIRVGRPSARTFEAPLGRLDGLVRDCLARIAGQVRPVATVLLPEALHVVACGSLEAVRALAAELGRILESAEVEAILEEPLPAGLRLGVAEPLRVSVLRVASLSGAAGTVLELPHARGLVRASSWPYAHSGEA